eukprot:4915465-Pyramimonas_sp.AAC.1
MHRPDGRQEALPRPTMRGGRADGLVSEQGGRSEGSSHDQLAVPGGPCRVELHQQPLRSVSDVREVRLQAGLRSEEG